MSFDWGSIDHIEAAAENPPFCPVPSHLLPLPGYAWPDSVGMNPTSELQHMPTAHLVYEIEMYRSAKAHGIHISPEATERIEAAKSELSRRWPKGWAATGETQGGGVAQGG